MRRRVLTTLAALALAWPAAAEPTAADRWIEVGPRGGAAVYRFPAAPAGAYPAMWLRMELPSGEFRSAVERLEVDCAANQIRIASLTAYRDPGLMGPSRPIAGTPTPWAPIRPGTLNAEVAALVCPAA